MELGIMLLIIAGLLCILNIVTLSLTRHLKHWNRITQGLSIGGACSVWASIFVLLKSIFDNNFSLKYILEHSSTNLSLELKLSVLWAGQEGSLLLWTALTFLFYIVFYRFFYKQLEYKLVRRSFIMASIFCVALVLITLIINPFALADEILQEGLGLNPLLRTLWNVIHPPLVFIGYAAATIPFSIVIARMTIHQFSADRDEHKRINDFLNFQMALTWLFLTLGIIIGGYWAYVTLGWGGYWAWDPVETTSLIAWLFCTAYFHGKNLFTEWGFGNNTLVFLTYFSIIFATFVTRSGIISSVHGFAESPVTLSFLVLMLGSLFTFVILVGFQMSASSFSLQAVNKKISGSKLMLALFISLICIIGLIGVSSAGVIYPIVLSILTGSQYSMEQAFFNQFSFPFAFGLVLSVFGCTFPNIKRNSVLLKLVGVSIGLGFVLFFFGLPTSSSLANLLLPLIVLSSFCIGARVVRDLRKISKAGSLLKASSHTMLHLGLCLILVGVLISANTQVSQEGWQIVGDSLDFGEILVQLNDVTVTQTAPTSYEIRGRFLAFENVQHSGDGYAVQSVESGWGAYSRPLIISNFWRDIHIGLHNIRLNPLTGAISQAYVEVKIIKFVSILWVGSLITLITIIAMLMVYANQFVKRWTK